MCACEHETYACTISYKSLTVHYMHLCAHLPPTITSSASGGEVSARDIYIIYVFSVFLVQLMLFMLSKPFSLCPTEVKFEALNLKHVFFFSQMDQNKIASHLQETFSQTFH